MLYILYTGNIGGLEPHSTFLQSHGMCDMKVQRYILVSEYPLTEYIYQGLHQQTLILAIDVAKIHRQP